MMPSARDLRGERLPVYPSTAFTYASETKTFVAEASGIKQLPVFVFIDSVSVQCFSLKSDRTGKAVVFALYTTERRDDEVTGWRYRPLRDQEIDPEVSVLIIND